MMKRFLEILTHPMTIGVAVGTDEWTAYHEIGREFCQP
jgi:hypothetical protein